MTYITVFGLYLENPAHQFLFNINTCVHGHQACIRFIFRKAMVEDAEDAHIEISEISGARQHRNRQNEVVVNYLVMLSLLAIIGKCRVDFRKVSDKNCKTLNKWVVKNILKGELFMYLTM